MGVAQVMSKCHVCLTSRIQTPGLWHENATSPHDHVLFINFHDVGLKECKNFKIHFTLMIQNQD